MTPNANQRKGLLQQARGIKEPKRTPKYRRGSVQNIGASLQPPKQILGEAGRVESENAAFLGQMKEFIGGKGMLVDQYKEAETARGVAEFEKANVGQREAFKDAINNGWIDNKDSPYFREAVTKSHTKNLLNRTSVDLYTAYEKWEGKNDPNSGSFDTWLAEQDEKIAINLEAIPDHILKADFHEQHQAIKRSLAQRHSAHLNDNYRYEALNEADLSFKALLSQHGNAMGIDFGNPQYDGLTTSQILKKQGVNEDRARRLGGLLKEIPIDGRGSTGEIPKNTQLKLEALAVNEGESGGIIDKVLHNLSGVNGGDLRSQAEFERERAALALPLRERDPEGADIAEEFVPFSSQRSGFQFKKLDNYVDTEKLNSFKGTIAFSEAYPELDYDDMMGDEYDKTTDAIKGHGGRLLNRFSGRTLDEAVADGEGWIRNRAIERGIAPKPSSKISPSYLKRSPTKDTSENELDRLAYKKPQSKLGNEVFGSTELDFKSDTKQQELPIKSKKEKKKNVVVKEVKQKLPSGGESKTTISTVVGKDFMKKIGGNSRDLANGLIDSLSKSGDPNSEFISTLKKDPNKSLAIVNKFLQTNPKYKGILGKKGWEGAFPVEGGWEKMEINSTEFAEFAKREMGGGK
jgi:hypothetical protein